MAQNKEPARRLRIVIAEDEALIALGLEQMVEGFGHTVCHVSATAADAISAAGQHRPDLVLMDVMLRESSGIDAARAIRQQFGIRSLFMTALDGPALRAEAATAEPLGFLRKPYRGEDLEARLRAVSQE